MPSRFEIYKRETSKERELQSDLIELDNLYKSNSQFYDKFTFDEFVTYSLENADTEPDATVLQYLQSKKDKTKPFKELRRVTVPWLSETIGGSASLASQLYKAQASPMAQVLTPFLPNQTEIQRGVNKAFQATGRAVGLGDIWDQKTDSKTGEKYYEVQEPVTASGKVIKPIGEFVAPLLLTRNPSSLISKGSKVIPQETVKRKVGRPSKAQLAKEARQASTQRLLGYGKGLAKAELASQVAFANDPEFIMVAGALSNYIGDDDNAMADLFNYLDVDEDSPEEARRLSLLLDGLVFSGGFAAGIGALKVTKESIVKMLKAVKNAGPEAKNNFKQVVQGGRNTRTATKKVDYDVPIIKDLEGPIFKDLPDFAYNGMNSGWKWMQENLYYGLFKKGGMYSEKMFNMLKSSEYNKIAWSKRAMDIHSKLVTGIKKAAQNSNIKKEDIEKVLQQYLTGATTLRAIPKELKPYAKEAKLEISNLSKMLLKSKHISKELRNDIEKNIGSYLRKTYDFYENKNFKPSQEVIGNAVVTIGKALQKKAGTKTVTRSQQNQAQEFVNDLLNRDNSYASFGEHLNKVFGVKSNEKVFQVRKNINPAIEALLGGKDVPASLGVFRTIETLSSQITNYKLYDDLYNEGLGKWFFRKEGKYSVAPNLEQRAATIQGEQFLQLNGLKTTEQIANMFNNMDRKISRNILSNAYRTFLAGKGTAQAAATVYNLLTHVRNTIGGSIILARNGINPFTEETIKSANILGNELFTANATQKNKALSDIYEEYQRLGLVNQNVRVGEFKALINDLVQNQNKNLYSYTNNLFKKAGRKATSLYVAEDDLWRIVAYNKELNTLKQAYPSRSVTQLKQEAADIVRNTMPTYDLISPTLQKIRMLPIGNFFSFTAEQFRNNYHTALRAATELRSGNKVLEQRGMRRLASQITTTYAGSKGITDLTKYAYGITDADEEAVRNLDLAPWSKDSALMFSRDENGNIQYVDLTYTDPSAPVTDVVRKLINEITDPTKELDSITKKIFDVSVNTFQKLIEPFASESLLTETITDVMYRNGRNKEGNLIRVTNPVTGEKIIWDPAGGAKNLDWALLHMSSSLIPREIKDVYSLSIGSKAEKIKRGEIELADELLAKFTGQRTTTLKQSRIRNNFRFKMFELNNSLSDYKKFVKDTITAGVNPETLLKSYEDKTKDTYKKFVRGKLALEAAKHLDIPLTVITSTANRTLSNYNKEEKNTFLESTNEFIPLRFTASDLEKLRQYGNFSKMSMQEFVTQYNLKYLEFSQLPILQPSSNIAEEPEETMEQGEEVQRKQFQEGGLALSENEPRRFSPEWLEQRDIQQQQEKERISQLSNSLQQNFRQGNMEKAYEDFIQLPFIDQMVMYMTPVVGNALDAYETQYFAKKAQPEFIPQEELNPFRDQVNVRYRDPAAAGMSFLAGASSLFGLGEVPSLVKGAILPFTRMGLRSRIKDDMAGGGSGGGKPPVDLSPARDNLMVSNLTKTLIETAPKNLRGQGILQWIDGNFGKGYTKEEVKLIKDAGFESFIRNNPNAKLEEAIDFVARKKPTVQMKIYKDTGGQGLNNIFTTRVDPYDPIDNTDYSLSFADDIISELESGTYNYPYDDFDGTVSGSTIKFRLAKMLKDETISDEMYEDAIMQMNEISDDMYDANFPTEDLPPDIIEALGEDFSRSAFMENPYKLIEADKSIIGEGTFNTRFQAYGNDDVGYRFIQDGELVDNMDPVSTEGEAKIVLQNKLREYGYLDNVAGEAQYKDYVINETMPFPNSSKYEEVVLTMDDLEAMGYDVFQSGHHSGENYKIGNVIKVNTKLSEGSDTMHVLEFQSDVHQQGAAMQGYNTQETKKYYKEVLIPELETRFHNQVKKILDMSDDEFTKMYKELIDDSFYAEAELLDSGIAKDLDVKDDMNKKIARRVDEKFGRMPQSFYRFKNAISNLEELPPDYPYKDFTPLAIKKTIEKAIEEGADTVSFPTSTSILERTASRRDYIEQLKIAKISEPTKLDRKVLDLDKKFRDELLDEWYQGVGQYVEFLNDFKKMKRQVEEQGASIDVNKDASNFNEKIMNLYEQQYTDFSFTDLSDMKDQDISIRSAILRAERVEKELNKLGIEIVEAPDITLSPKLEELFDSTIDVEIMDEIKAIQDTQPLTAKAMSRGHSQLSALLYDTNTDKFFPAEHLLNNARSKVTGQGEFIIGNVTYDPVNNQNIYKAIRGYPDLQSIKKVFGGKVYNKIKQIDESGEIPSTFDSDFYDLANLNLNYSAFSQTIPDHFQKTFKRIDGKIIEIQSEVGSGQGFITQYDEKVPSQLKKIAKRYGGKYEEGKLDFYSVYDDSDGRLPYSEIEGSNAEKRTEVYILRITPEMKRKIRREGLPSFAKGGIVEGPEVPFTKEDPADRVNPYTGEPYQEQMTRLGLGEQDV